MGRFDFAADKKQQQQSPLPKVSGSFQCQHCFDVVFEASYSIEHKTLAWQCKEGHISTLKDFYI